MLIILKIHDSNHQNDRNVKKNRFVGIFRDTYLTSLSNREIGRVTMGVRCLNFDIIFESLSAKKSRSLDFASLLF